MVTLVTSMSAGCYIEPSAVPAWFTIGDSNFWTREEVVSLSILILIVKAL